MGFSLLDSCLRLYWLTRANLIPEEYKRILSPDDTWREICRDYKFNGGHNGGYLLRLKLSV